MRPPTEPRSRWRWLPVALAAALALLELSCLGGIYCGDTTTFLSHTHAAGSRVRFNLVNPGFPLLLDALIALLPAGGRMAALVVLQQAAIVATTWLVLRCGELAGRPRAGFCAALATALYVPLGFAAHVALSDGLFAFLVVATAWAFLRALAATNAGAGSSPRAWLAWLVAGLCAAAAMAWRSSGVALVAAAVVALLFTRPRAQFAATCLFGLGFAGAFLLVLAKNRVQHGDWRLIQGGGIHLYCRVATLERALPDTPQARQLQELAQAHGHATPLFEQAGWELHQQLVTERGLSPQAADDLLYAVAWQAFAADPWRSARLTLSSMASAVGRADAANYVLHGALRPAAFASADEDARLIGGHHDEHFARMRDLLPPYPPRAAQGDPRYALLEAGSRLARGWCGAWLLYALLAFGLLGLWRRDAALVFLAGAAFAQLAASAIGDVPWVGHFDPVAPLCLLAAGFSGPARPARAEGSGR